MTQSFEERFDEKFKCIQSDCDGRGYIPYPVDDGVWEADQCQFHAEYLDPIKSFIRQEKELSRKEGYEEGYQAGRDSIFNQGGLVFLGKGPKTEDLNETT